MTTTTNNKMINYIQSFGFEVINHQDGTFTVYDSNDPENGWKIVRSEDALDETVQMILVAQK